MNEQLLVNRTFDEIRLGDSASLVRALTSEDLRLFAAVSGDANPTHVEEEYARHFLSVMHSVMLRQTVDGAFTKVEDVAEAAVFFAAFPSLATGQSLIVSHGRPMQ
jgi:acyl dehydratase